MTTSTPWPPSGYFWSKNPVITTQDRTEVVVPIHSAIFTLAGGERVMRYQLTETPVEPGSVFMDGYLRTDNTGELFDRENEVVGAVNFTTGFIEIDIGKSPDLGSRRVQYVVAT